MLAKLLLISFAALGAFGAMRHQNSDPTFNKDIGPMIFSKCTPCHRPNGAAPIPLMNYFDVKRNAGLVRVQTLTQAMPPCPIQSDFGDFCDVKPLNDDELLAIQKWIQNGMPEGDAPAPKPDLPTQNWTIGKPDVVLEIAKHMRTRPEGARYWQVYVVDIPKNLTRISGFDILPNKPYSLQGVTVAVSQPGAKIPKAPFETSGSLDAVGPNWIGVWSPRTSAWRLPEGFAKKLPAGGKLLVQAHYQPTGKTEDAGFKLGFRLAPASSRVTDWISFDKREFLIGAGAAPDFAFDYTLRDDRRLVAIVPEARFFATRTRLLATFPTGETKTVFENYRWNPYYIGNWGPKLPLILPKGTRLKAIISYANDETCAMNERKKPQQVVSGPKITDEVCRMHLLLVPAR